MSPQRPAADEAALSTGGDAHPPEPVSNQEEPGSPEPDGKGRWAGPSLPPLTAAVLTGLVVGLVGTALTYASLRGCEAVRGTESCGGPGLFVLVAIVVAMALIGTLLLAWLRVSDPRGTSFLGVGLVCVVVLVTLLQAVFSAWMFLVVPTLTAAAFGLSHWVATRFVDQVERGPEHDVR